MALFKKTATTSDDISCEPSDYQVIAQVLDGDINRYEVIMRRYNQRLFRVTRCIVMDDALAMDAVQEAHIKAYQKLDRFTGTNGFPAWLSTIARNEALMALRKRKADNVLPIDIHALDDTTGAAMTVAEKTSSAPDGALENQQLRAELNAHIDSLPENFRTVFVMRGIEQLSTRETAEILNLNEITVKTRYFRAKALLQERLAIEYRAHTYHVGGAHCDAIVKHVLLRLRCFGASG